MRLLVLAASLASFSSFGATEEDLWKEARTSATAFEKRTGVPMQWLEGDPAKGQSVGDEVIAWPPSALDVTSSAPALLNELTIYPDAFLKSSGLKRVVIARGLERHGTAWGGFAFWAGPKKGTLYVSLRNLARAAVTIHHEVFHLTQHTSAIESRRDSWSACNPPGFVYAVDGEIDRTRQRVATITGYARTSLVEDQAEMFAWAVSDGAFMAQQSQQDEAIACKAKLIRTFVKLVDSGFDDARWEKLASRKPGDSLP